MDNVTPRPRSVKPDRPASAPIARASIHGYVYAVRRLAIHPSIGSVAFALDKLATRTSYAVHRGAHGEVCCDCPDFAMRRAGTGRTCKHGQALIDLGLIDPPAPAVLPPSSRRAATPAVVISPPARAESPVPAVRRPEPSPVVTPPARRRRFEPTPEDNALAAAMFA